MRHHQRLVRRDAMDPYHKVIINPKKIILQSKTPQVVKNGMFTRVKLQIPEPRPSFQTYAPPHFFRAVLLYRSRVCFRMLLGSMHCVSVDARIISLLLLKGRNKTCSFLLIFVYCKP
jgi:hypothetical protein